MAPGTRVRMNYTEQCEAQINKQINLELYASYVYLSMAYYFDRDDVALPGFHEFFKKQSAEENEHAQKFMAYQNKRGGRVVLQNIQKPENDEWGTSLEALEAALKLEKVVNQALLDLHETADSAKDGHLTDFIEGEFLNEQVDSISQFSSLITQLKRAGPGVGEYLFDKQTMSNA